MPHKRAVFEMYVVFGVCGHTAPFLCHAVIWTCTCSLNRHLVAQLWWIWWMRCNCGKNLRKKNAREWNVKRGKNNYKVRRTTNKARTKQKHDENQTNIVAHLLTVLSAGFWSFVVTLFLDLLFHSYLFIRLWSVLPLLKCKVKLFEWPKYQQQ